MLAGHGSCHDSRARGCSVGGGGTGDGTGDGTSDGIVDGTGGGGSVEKVLDRVFFNFAIVAIVAFHAYEVRE